MRTSLTPLDDALHEVLRSLSPLPPRPVGVAEAAGAWLAEPLLSPRSLPSRTVALRSGLAVASLELAGASPHAPVMLDRPPVPVAAGEQLPPPCDAVIDEAAVTASGPMILVTDAVAPGFGARLCGHDLAQGAVLLAAGSRLTPQAILACRLAGIESADVRRVAVSLAVDDAAHAAWLAATLAALGCDIVGSAEAAHLHIATTHRGTPRLALAPGDTAWIAPRTEGRVSIEVPWRFDGLLAAYAALVLPVLARLLALQPHTVSLPLERKIASQIGITELALFRTSRHRLEPLATADVTIAAMARADAFALIDARSEGHAAGEVIEGVALGEPLIASP